MIDNDTIEVVEKIIHFLPLLSFLFGLLTFSIGIVVGHYQAIRRDKRKEFNEIAEPLLEYYEEMLIELNEPGYINTTEFPIHSLGKISRRLSVKNEDRFMALVKEILALKTQRNDENQHELVEKIKATRKIIRLR
ncbi:hypothetical protein ACLEEB_14345 [Lonsdalea quercina]|uniref:hypothetical protein n=1 Tax=Lonsdalea quercina TaxID=71657 RepID=UPI003976D090